MKKNIGIVTGTRAEYHLLYPLIKQILESDRYELKLIVTGAHLSEKYGNTVQDIEADNVPIAVRIPILSGEDKSSDINSAMSKLIMGMDRFLSEQPLDLLLLLGDRYEVLSAAIAAMNYRIPIGHISGGDTTEGAIDECIRHAVTKMSLLHFPSNEESRKRIIQMGENPERVYNVGSLGVENIKNTKLMSRKELEESIGFKLGDHFMVLTFHPVTLEENTAQQEFSEVLAAVDRFPDMKIIFTKANADAGGQVINRMIDTYVEEHSDRATSFFSMGLQRYLSAISMADVVVGNSSSGILETPSFGTPTVNIGDRQKGRLSAENIINCEPVEAEVDEAINRATSSKFRDSAKGIANPYGDGYTSRRIVEVMDTFFEHPESYSMKKQFFEG